MTEIRFALDRASVRSIDQDGHLHVTRTPVSKGNVCGYLGSEIPGYDELGLDPNKIYELYRDPVELEKAVSSFNGKPLLFGHKPVTADDHDHDMTVGSVTGAEWEAPYLYAALDIWSGPAIRAIEGGWQKELSSGYRYVPVMEPGTTPDGIRFDGRMTQIVCNHVAVVEAGRAGPDVVVQDAALPKRFIPNLKELFMPVKAASPRTAATAAALSGALSGALMVYARPKMAADAQIDVLSLLKGVTAKNVKSKAPAIAKAFDAALKGRLAKDADLDSSEVQDIVEQVAEVMSENSEAIAAELSPDIDATTDEDDAQLKGMLKAKGYSDEEVEAICNKSTAPAADAEADKAKEADKIKTAADAAVRAATKGMVSQSAMDAAITAAVQLARDSEVQRQRDLREAEAHVRPVVGTLAVAQDSTEGVYREALKALNVADADKLPGAALRPVFDAHAAVKQAPTVQHAALAADASITGKSIDEMFPALKRLHG